MNLAEYTFERFEENRRALQNQIHSILPNLSFNMTVDYNDGEFNKPDIKEVVGSENKDVEVIFQITIKLN